MNQLEAIRTVVLSAAEAVDDMLKAVDLRGNSKDILQLVKDGLLDEASRLNKLVMYERKSNTNVGIKSQVKGDNQ